MNAEFVQLLDSVKRDFALTDEGVSEVISFEPSYLSKVRKGKANAGPKLMSALKNFAELHAQHLHKAMNDTPSAGLKRFEVEVQNLRVRFDYGTQSELEYAVQKAEALIQRLKAELPEPGPTNAPVPGADVVRKLAKAVAAVPAPAPQSAS